MEFCLQRGVLWGLYLSKTTTRKVVWILIPFGIPLGKLPQNKLYENKPSPGSPLRLALSRVSGGKLSAFVHAVCLLVPWVVFQRENCLPSYMQSVSLCTLKGVQGFQEGLSALCLGSWEGLACHYVWFVLWIWVNSKRQSHHSTPSPLNVMSV